MAAVAGNPAKYPASGPFQLWVGMARTWTWVFGDEFTGDFTSGAYTFRSQFRTSFAADATVVCEIAVTATGPKTLTGHLTSLEADKLRDLPYDAAKKSRGPIVWDLETTETATSDSTTWLYHDSVKVKGDSSR